MSPQMHTQLTIGLQRERVVVTQQVPAYYWRCELCGWLGTGHLSIHGAMNEAGDHARDVHGLSKAEVQRVDWSDGPFIDRDDELAALVSSDVETR